MSSKNPCRTVGIVADTDGGRAVKGFVLTAGTALAITGMAKAYSAIGAARALDVADPIIGVSFRDLLLSVGLVELFIAFICLFTDRRTR